MRLSLRISQQSTIIKILKHFSTQHERIILITFSYVQSICNQLQRNSKQTVYSTEIFVVHLKQLQLKHLHYVVQEDCVTVSTCVYACSRHLCVYELQLVIVASSTTTHVIMFSTFLVELSSIQEHIIVLQYCCTTIVEASSVTAKTLHPQPTMMEHYCKL